MKRKIRLLSITLAFMLMFAAMLAPVSQAMFAVYSDYTDEPSLVVRASLQANKASDANYFTNMYAAMRYDATGVGTLTAYALEMKIYVTGYRVTGSALTWDSGQVTVEEGDYMNISLVKIDESKKVYRLKGVYDAWIENTSISYNPADIDIYASDY